LVTDLDRTRIRVCVLRTGGTNCDAEVARAFKEFGARVDVVQSKKMSSKNSFDHYEILVFPGGFANGDYVRAGAIWSTELTTKLGSQLKDFVESGRLIMGICNGFQVLVEAGLLPAFDGICEQPQMVLATNNSARYECRWTTRDEFLYLRHESQGNCAFTSKISEGKRVRIPIGHGEGRVEFSKDVRKEYLRKLIKNDQIIFRYVREDGSYPNGEYPYSPNGSFYDIAGICNPQGNVFGLMPHPERAFYGWQLPDFTRMSKIPKYGDGYLIFDSAIKYVEQNI